MSESYTIARDLKEVDAMVKTLVPYVHQDALYGHAGNNMPSLTIGAVLLRLRRLNELADQLDAQDRSKLGVVQQRHDEILNEWRLHYTQKLLREAKSRLDAMKRFFEECSEDPRLCASAYKPEALRRTIAQEILNAMESLNVDDDDELQTSVRGADSGLRRYTEPADFAWDGVLEAVYPKKEFWWLYQRPPLPGK